MPEARSKSAHNLVPWGSQKLFPTSGNCQLSRRFCCSSLTQRTFWPVAYSSSPQPRSIWLTVSPPRPLLSQVPFKQAPED